MIRRLVILSFALLINGTQARAEFNLINTSQGSKNNYEPVQQREAASSITGLTAESMFPVARGFGYRIPLALAVKQIVPPEIKVHFAAGVDPTRLVVWVGNKPWNIVLHEALQPLGLFETISADSVSIES